MPDERFTYPRSWFYGLLLALLAVDQGSKEWAQRFLSLQPHSDPIILIPGWFDLMYVQNTGVAFGMMSGNNLGLAVMSIVLLALAVYFGRSLNWRSWETNVTAALLVSGALGNVIDRFRYGYVVDFFHAHYGESYHFPVFNVADSCICVAVGWILLRQIAWPDPSPEKAKPAEAVIAPAAPAPKAAEDVSGTAR